MYKYIRERTVGEAQRARDCEKRGEERRERVVSLTPPFLSNSFLLLLLLLLPGHFLFNSLLLLLPIFSFPPFLPPPSLLLFPFSNICLLLFPFPPPPPPSSTLSFIPHPPSHSPRPPSRRDFRQFQRRFLLRIWGDSSISLSNPAPFLIFVRQEDEGGGKVLWNEKENEKLSYKFGIM